MKKQLITVTTDVGTFTRTTARTYTHIVVGRQTGELLAYWMTRGHTPETFVAFGWAGRLDLAHKNVRELQRPGMGATDLRIYDVATGQRVDGGAR